MIDFAQLALIRDVESPTDGYPGKMALRAKASRQDAWRMRQEALGDQPL